MQIYLRFKRLCWGTSEVMVWFRFNGKTLDSIEKSRAARLAGSRDQYRALCCRTRTLLRRDKKRYVRSLAEDVEDHLNANDLKPAY